jgi:biotin carboxylase
MAGKRHIVCIASEHKGNEFLEECHDAGWHVTLVTRDKLLDEGWAWTALSDVKTVRDDAAPVDYVREIANLAGQRPIDRITGLDEFDILTAAQAREHLQVSGISNSYGLRFRDKLRMRNLACDRGIPHPEFTRVLNAVEINAYLDRAPGPWIVKPRTEVSAFGIRKCETREQVWEVLKGLDDRNTWRDHPSQFLIEQFIEGEVFHVDSIVTGGKVVAAGVSRYGTTPLNVSSKGGVYTSSTIEYGSSDRMKLERLNSALLEGFGYKKGVAHAEFLKSAETGEFYLLEVACRVGGAYTANVLEAACGFNLWREWAKLETETDDRPYRGPKLRQEYAGVALCLANTEHPDTSPYTDPEIIYRIKKPKHAGFVIASRERKRVDELLAEYAKRLSEDFLEIGVHKERYDD